MGSQACAPAGEDVVWQSWGGGCLGLPECAGPGRVHGVLARQFADLQGLLLLQWAEQEVASPV